MTVKCWVVEPVNEPRQYIHADQMWNVREGNLVFTLDGVLVRAFARNSYFEVSLNEDNACMEDEKTWH